MYGRLKYIINRRDWMHQTINQEPKYNTQIFVYLLELV